MSEPKPIVAYGQRCLLCRNDAAASRVLCWKHIDELGEMLDEDNEGRPLDDLPPSIPVMWGLLDTTPGSSGLAERRAPGFVSTPPCTLHIVAMRDPRSCAHAVVDFWYSAGPDGYPDIAHPHFESDNAVRSVEKSLRGLGESISAELDEELPAHRTVAGLCSWLYGRVKELSRLAWADDMYRDLRDLREQLRRVPGVWGPPPKPLGYCANDIVLDRVLDIRGPCDHPLYPPAGAKPMARDEPIRDVPIVVCARCHAEYDGLAQLRLRIAELKGAS